MSEEVENVEEVVGQEPVEETTHKTPRKPHWGKKSESLPDIDENEVMPEKETSAHVMVRIVNMDAQDGKYIIQDAGSGKLYLVPADSVRQTVKDQPIEKSVINSAEKPYNWDNEIAALALTPDQIRRALWKTGAKPGEDLRSILVKLLSVGALPIIKE